jgi:hypothetical protein
VDAHTYVISALIGATAIVLAGLIPQFLAMKRAEADRKLELKRDHERRVFEYKRSMLERNRAACTKMLTTLSEFNEIIVKHRDVMASLEEQGPAYHQLTAEEETATRAGDTAKAAQLREEMRRAEEVLTATGEDLSRLEAQLAEHKAALEESAHVLQLDSSGLEIMEAYAVFMQIARADSNSEQEAVAYRRCAAVMRRFLEEAQKDLLHGPPVT